MDPIAPTLTLHGAAMRMPRSLKGISIECDPQLAHPAPLDGHRRDP